MVTTLGHDDLYFLPQDETFWHITTDRDALCGHARLRFNVDDTADTLPYGASLCAECQRIRDSR